MVMKRWGQKRLLQDSIMRSALLTLVVTFLVLSSCCVAAFPRNIGVPVPYGDPCSFSRLNPKPKGLSVYAECSSPCALQSTQQILVTGVEDVSSSSNFDQVGLLVRAAEPAESVDLRQSSSSRGNLVGDEVEGVSAATVEELARKGASTSRRLLSEDCSNSRNGQCGGAHSRKLAQTEEVFYPDANSYLPYDTSSNMEAQILMDFRYGLNDSQKNVLANWNFTVQPQFCNWTGIECDLSDQHVIAIRLAGQKLSGQISSGLSGLPMLATLDLSYNRLVGNLPADLVNASVLVNLDLSYNRISGEIPAFGKNTPILVSLKLVKNRLSGSIPASLGECLELRNISLSQNRLRGSIPPELGSLTKLQTLYLKGNRLNGTMPPSLGNCISLISLDVGWNQITMGIPDEYRALRSVEGFYLNGNFMNGTVPNWLASLPSLAYLHLYANDFSGAIPEELGSSKSLQSINLSNNSLTGSVPLSLTSSPLLFEIDLSVNNLTGFIPHELASLQALRELRLESNQLTGEIPSSFSDCVSLVSIALSKNQLSGAILELDKLQNLRRLSLEENLLDGSIPESVTLCTNLAQLNLSRNYLTGSLPEDLGNLKSLSYLGLSHNELSGSLPASLVECSALQELVLSDNSFTGDLPVDIGLLQSVEYIDLSNNSLEGILPEDIGKLTRLRYLNLGRNSFQGVIPESLGSLLQLEGLFLGYNELEGGIPSQLSALSNLQTLALNDNNLNGSIPESIGTLHNLNVLYLQGNLLSGSIPSTLGNLTELQDFSLAENRLVGEIPPSLLTGLSGLQANFSLGHNRLSGSIPPEIGSLSRVKSINLTSNSLSDIIPEEVGDCTALLRLDLSSNELTGTLPISLGNLHNLQVLNVSNNEIGGFIPTTLGALDALVDLDLAINKFSGSIPKSLVSLAHLVFLNVSENNLSGEVNSTGAFQHLTADSFLGNPLLCGAIVGRNCSGTPGGGSNGGVSKWIYFGVAIAAFIILAVLAVALFIWCRSPYPVGQPQGPSRGSIIARSELFYPQLRFTAQDLKLATENFSDVNILGTGSMSQVYRGVLPELVLVAIKKLKFPTGVDIPSRFVNELDELTRLRHKHLVAVLGFCFEADLNALVVQFMSNGSLEEHLHKSRDLDWAARAKIALGVAKALAYLHHECGPSVVHCDLKPSNILLDAEFEPHLEDFGLSRLIFAHRLVDISDSSLGSSIGYFPPEYLHSPTVSPKGDVYSYGIVLLEMLTGKRPSSDMFQNEMTIKRWCQASYPERTQEVLDPGLLAPAGASLTASNIRQISQYMKVALMCTREIPEERPTMSYVVDLLK